MPPYADRRRRQRWRVCHTGLATAQLRQRVEEEWDRLDQETIDNAISEWRKRLTACDAAGGGHFEHSL